MECIIGNKGMGKATQIVRKSFDTKQNIICATDERKEILNTIAKFHKYEIPTIYTIREYVYGVRTRESCSESIIIDEAELSLEEILSKQIAYMSLTI